MKPYLSQPLAFPSVLPAGFTSLADEPVFDAAKHLQLETPETVYSLADLGYSEQEIADCPTPFGATSVFRLLSDEGAEAMLAVAGQLEEFTTSNARIARNVRGGTYRSKFLRDLCLCPEVTEHMSKICGIPLHPHTIPHQLGHLNYNPEVVGDNVDKWHVDTLRIDYVMFVTDPKSVQGGEFQYYKGTKGEFGADRKAGKPVPEEKIVSPDMPGPGYAVLQQGNMVVHRAKGLSAPGKRITMVNGYVPQNIRFPDFSRYDQLAQIDPADVAASEYARHIQWMTRERLDADLAEFEFNADKSQIANAISSHAETLGNTAKELTAQLGEVEHFGDG